MATPRPTPVRRHASPLLLRLLPEQHARLEKAARLLGKTMTDLVRDAVMATISEIEEDVRAARYRDEEDEAREITVHRGRRRAPWGHPLPPLGEDIAPRLGEYAPREREPAPTPRPRWEPAQAPTVIVNASQSGDDMVDRLAQHVLAAKNSIDRAERERHVEKILLQLAPERADAERIAAALDAKIANATKTPTQPSSASTAWNWLTRKS